MHACRRASLMGELLFGYLVHHAYWETAAAVARDLLDGKVKVSDRSCPWARPQQAVRAARCSVVRTYLHGRPCFSAHIEQRNSCISTSNPSCVRPRAWETIAQTAQLLLCCIQVSPREVEEVALRAAVAQAVAAGHVEEAAAAAEALAPGVLEAYPRVRFRLRAQAFVELVSGCSFVHLRTPQHPMSHVP